MGVRIPRHPPNSLRPRDPAGQGDASGGDLLIGFTPRGSVNLENGNPRFHERHVFDEFSAKVKTHEYHHIAGWRRGNSLGSYPKDRRFNSYPRNHTFRGCRTRASTLAFQAKDGSSNLLIRSILKSENFLVEILGFFVDSSS